MMVSLIILFIGIKVTQYFNNHLLDIIVTMVIAVTGYGPGARTIFL